MTSNSDQNQNQRQTSGHSYRRNRRPYAYGNGFQTQSSDTYYPNSGYQYPNPGQYYPNPTHFNPNSSYNNPNSGHYYPNAGYNNPNRDYNNPNAGYYYPNSNDYYPNSEPTQSHSRSNDRNFVNFAQNYNTFNANETQTNSQSLENNGSNEEPKNRVVRHEQRRRPKKVNVSSNEGNSRMNETNVESESGFTADHKQRENRVLEKTSNGNRSEPKNNWNNRRERNKYKNESKDESRGRGHQRSYDRRPDNRSDKSAANGSGCGDRYEKSKSRVETNSSKSSDKSKAIKAIPESEETQREIMEEMLRKGSFECMVCVDQIKIRDQVWSCEHCYNVFHLKCIKMWANSQSAQSLSHNQCMSWRCPACQANHRRLPSTYRCFCGKTKEPELNRYLTPHSCGQMCGRKRLEDPKRKHNCPHKCLLLCHAGKCPPCEAKVTRECGCGQTKVVVNCATNDEDVVCNSTCSKQLSCGQHFCQKACHFGACDNCPLIITQNCFCGQNQKQVKCDIENNLIEKYCCQQKCNKTLDCGQHKCSQTCHWGECTPCPLAPESVTHCSCGKTELKLLTQTKRQSCTDPIPTCDQICDKELVCGPEQTRHRCQSICHLDACPPCSQKTVIRCRCGANSANIECVQLITEEDKTFVCKKRCNKKRGCGRHKCIDECCVDSQHLCQQICGKRLTCQVHTCQEFCHNSECAQCWNVSWDELTCRCGSAVKLPPIACGTKRPECGLKCSRSHSCDHPIDHNCHDDEQCPPCTYFTPKVCYGAHEKRPVPCYETGFSCGFLCAKPLECGLHECGSLCHPGDCSECTLPCPKSRPDCEHPCGLKCHQKTAPNECPRTQCKVMVKVFCDCGRKTDSMQCFRVNDENSLRLSMNALANQRVKNGESVNITEIMKKLRDFKNIQLKCDDKCAVIERNRQLAEALDIKGADFSPEPGRPKYSDLLKNGARTDPTFVSDVYEKLAKLVLESKQSKLSFKNYSFAPMNSENRHIIHEMAEHFGLKTHAVDREPNRSVVVKAAKDKCYLPTISLMDVIKEELESRKTTANKTNRITLKNYSFGAETNDSNNVLAINTGISMIRNISNDTNQSTNKNNNQQNTKQTIDYFDFNGD